jgi:hypothetical protein
VDLEKAASDWLFRVYEGVQDDTTLFVDDTHLADHTLVLALVHLAVNGHKQRKIVLTENV